MIELDIGVILEEISPFHIQIRVPVVRGKESATHIGISVVDETSIVASYKSAFFKFSNFLEKSPNEPFKGEFLLEKNLNHPSYHPIG